MPMLYLSARFIQSQQTRGITLLQRSLRDQFFRQIKVKIMRFQKFIQSFPD
jgi:hypothetical protein